MNPPTVCVMAAIEETTRAMGKDNQLLWSLPGDLPRFKAFTFGHAVVMGRKTFESIGSKPLQDRHCIIVSKTLSTKRDVIIVPTFERALECAQAIHSDKVFAIGGKKIFEEALLFADILYLTLVSDPNIEADVFFPEYKHLFGEITNRQPKQAGRVPFRYATFTKKL